jgi:hypothetical protein
LTNLQQYREILACVAQHKDIDTLKQVFTSYANFINDDDDDDEEEEEEEEDDDDDDDDVFSRYRHPYYLDQEVHYAYDIDTFNHIITYAAMDEDWVLAQEKVSWLREHGQFPNSIDLEYILDLPDFVKRIKHFAQSCSRDMFARQFASNANLSSTTLTTILKYYFSKGHPRREAVLNEVGGLCGEGGTEELLDDLAIETICFFRDSLSMEVLSHLQLFALEGTVGVLAFFLDFYAPAMLSSPNRLTLQLYDHAALSGNMGVLKWLREDRKWCFPESALDMAAASKDARTLPWFLDSPSQRRIDHDITWRTLVAAASLGRISHLRALYGRICGDEEVAVRGGAEEKKKHCGVAYVNAVEQGDLRTFEALLELGVPISLGVPLPPPLPPTFFQPQQQQQQHSSVWPLSFIKEQMLSKKRSCAMMLCAVNWLLSQVDGQKMMRTADLHVDDNILHLEAEEQQPTQPAPVEIPWGYRQQHLHHCDDAHDMIKKFNTPSTENFYTDFSPGLAMV